MSGAWSGLPKGMQRVEVTEGALFHDGIIRALNATGITRAEFGEDDEGMPVCTQAGYRVTVERRTAHVSLFGRSDLSNSARQAEQDGMMQQARAAFDATGYGVRVSEYGYLMVTPPRLLSCGLCYEENGEEIHPHPGCTQ